MFSLVFYKLFLVGKNQGLERITDLMTLLENGGFFRDNGLNSLPSIKHLGSLLNDQNIFRNVGTKVETIVSFVRNSEFSEQKLFAHFKIV